MLKKGIGSLLAITLLSVGGTGVFASENIVQDQTNEASLSQTQSPGESSTTNLVRNQRGNTNFSSVQLGNFGIAGQGQAGSVTGIQVQSAKTIAPTVLTQSQLTQLKLSDQQTANSTQQRMDTASDIALNQSTIVEEPSQVVQAQFDHTSAIHFQGSVPGGPTIQYQQLHRTSLQYQNAVKTVTPN